MTQKFAGKEMNNKRKNIPTMKNPFGSIVIEKKRNAGICN
jgi:hypothetical protein